MAELLRAAGRGTLLLAALCGAFAGLARGHGIDLHVHAEGDLIRGRALFVGGGPVAGARVTVHAPSGSRLGSTQTDNQGVFTFVPREAVDHRFWLYDGAGHGAECTVKAGDLPASVMVNAVDGSAATAATLSKAVTDAVAPLHKKIDRLQSSIRLHDVLGGIGYIAGLTGFWFYFKALRLRRRPVGSGSQKQ
jgi:nickel transport protein